MLKQKGFKYFVVFMLLSFLIIGVTVYNERQVFASNKADLSSIGGFIKNNTKNLSEAITCLKEKRISDSRTIAWINGVPISFGEYEFRKGMGAVTGNNNENDIFNKLIEEKVILAQALKENLIPSSIEIEEFINQQKAEYNNPELEYKQIVDTICKNASLSLEEYWNSYEWYNTYRLLTISKVYQYEAAEAQKLGELPAAFDKDGKYFLQNENLYKEFWNKKTKDLIANAKIKLNNKTEN